MKKLIVAVAAALLLPLAAAAQAGPGPGPGPGWRGGPGGPGGPGMRGRIALTLGLAETLGLDENQTIKLREVVDRFHDRMMPLHQQQHDAMEVLRKSAAGEKVDAAAVDQALARLLEARTQEQVVHRELVQTVTKDQPPAKKARAVIFLARFHQRMMERMGMHGRGPGRGPGMGPGMHRGMGPGMAPPDAGGGDGEPWEEDL